MGDIPDPVRPDGKPIHPAFLMPWETWIHSGIRLVEFARIDAEYFATNPGETFVETDCEAGRRHFKFRYKTPPPRLLKHVAADVVSNLRASLDQATYACSIARGRNAPQRTYFPFGDTADAVSRLRGSRGSADVPVEIFDVLASFEPHKHGNLHLWALNKLNNAYKHRLTVSGTPSAMHAMEAGLRVPRVGFHWTDEKPLPKWDSEKCELTWASTSIDSDLIPKPQLLLFLSFLEPEELNAYPALDVMKRMRKIVQSILIKVEDEAKSSGLLP